MISYIKSDLYRYNGYRGKLSFIKAIFQYPGFRVTFFYRITKYYKSRNRSLFILFRLLHRHYVYKYGIDIPIDATIGYGLYIGHFGGIVISPAAVIGDNCNLSQGVTIGVSGRGENRGVPVLGNELYIAPGAKVFGKITLGNHIAIGANAVVNKSFPDHSVLTGIPASAISLKGSDGMILYPFFHHNAE